MATFKAMALTTLNATITGLTAKKSDTLARVSSQAVYQIAAQSKKDAKRRNGNKNPMVALAAKFSEKTVGGVTLRQFLELAAPFIVIDDEGVTLADNWQEQAAALDFNSDKFTKQFFIDLYETETKRRKDEKENEVLNTAKEIEKFIDAALKRKQSNPELIDSVKELLEAYHAENNEEEVDNVIEIEDAV